MFKLFDLAKTESINVEVYSKGRVFNVTFEPTNKKHKRTYTKPFPGRPSRPAVTIETDTCTKCEHIVIAGICINKKCPTNIKPEA